MTPFELRYAVFNTAKSFLEEQYNAQMEAFDIMNKTAEESAVLLPKFPTMAEILDAAIEINKFVSTSTEQHLVKTAQKLTGF